MMTTAFDKLTVETAVERIPNRNEQWPKDNLAFYNGDHWQEGRGWSGPMLDSSHEKYATTLAKVKAGFVSKNIIAEVTDRHVAGVIGRAPGRSVTVQRPLTDDKEPTTEEQALIDEANALLDTWWGAARGTAARSSGSDAIKQCAPQEVVQLAVASALLTRRGVLRLFVTPAAVKEGGDGTAVLPKMDIQQAIDQIFVNHAESAQAAVVVDKATMKAAGLYAYKDGDDELVETTFVDDEEDGRTVIRIVDKEGEKQRVGLLLGGRLLMHEIERRELVTEQVRQAQKAYNKAKTTGSRNLDNAFLERVFFNAQLPGTKNADGTVTPGEFRTGAGTANFLAGLPVYNDQGQVSGYSSPSAHYQEPTPSNVFIESGGDYYKGILEEVGQLHTLMTSDATASGESRIQAKGEFENSLMSTKDEVDAALRWLFETVLALAAAIAGTPGKFDSLRVTAEARLDLGVVSIEEQRQTAEAHNAGLLSRETAIRRIGIDDPAAEAALIDAEADDRLVVIERRAKAAKALVDAGFDRLEAAKEAGFDEETARRLASNGRVLKKDEM